MLEQQLEAVHLEGSATMASTLAALKAQLEEKFANDVADRTARQEEVAAEVLETALVAQRMTLKAMALAVMEERETELQDAAAHALNEAAEAHAVVLAAAEAEASATEGEWVEANEALEDQKTALEAASRRRRRQRMCRCRSINPIGGSTSGTPTSRSPSCWLIWRRARIWRWSSSGRSWRRR
jgi:hypothetical protein